MKTTQTRRVLRPWVNTTLIILASLILLSLAHIRYVDAVEHCLDVNEPTTEYTCF